MNNPLGSVFSENIVRGRHRFRGIWGGAGLHGGNTADSRLFFLALILFPALGTLFFRLFYLTGVEGGRYKELSSGNRVREIRIPAPRGVIYDRNRIPLVRNIPYFTDDSGLKYFGEIQATFSGRLKENVAREYIYKDLTAHVLGYVGEAGRDDLDIVSGKSTAYKMGDIIGKTGIEKQYDYILRGIDGKELEEVDALGTTVRVLGRVEPQSGKNLPTTLDVNLQKSVSEAFKDKKGAAVAVNPITGEVLSLFSSPSFDPNNFIVGENLSLLLGNPDQPIFNRTISGSYPPGSTYKIVTALAALQNGAITAKTMFEDTGILKVGDFSFGNWYFLQYGRKEGMVDVVAALKRSNDIFFYKVGEALGIRKLADFSKSVGMGAVTGIDLPGEVKGLMPDPEWVKKAKGENWYLGNTYHVAIGQGDILTTPLQVNSWTNLVASGGKLCSPYLAGGQSCRNIDIKREYLELVREGMKEACGTGGTGWPLFKFKIQNPKIKIDNTDFFEAAESTASGKRYVGIPVACKTGTAEFGDPKNRTHAWFTAFAPVYHPQISVTVLVEGGGEGSSVAGPIAGKIFEAWFSR